MVNVLKLKGKIVEQGLNISSLAAKLGMNKTTLYRKLSKNGNSFSIEEAQAIVSALKLSPDEAQSIFFS